MDAGWNTDIAWTALEQGLDSMGAQMSDVEAVLVTHIHPDHYGLAGRVREASGAWVALHPADAAIDRVVGKALQQLLPSLLHELPCRRASDRVEEHLEDEEPGVLGPDLADREVECAADELRLSEARKAVHVAQLLLGIGGGAEPGEERLVVLLAPGGRNDRHDRPGQVRLDRVTAGHQRLVQARCLRPYVPVGADGAEHVHERGSKRPRPFGLAALRRPADLREHGPEQVANVALKPPAIPSRHDPVHEDYRCCHE